jgi:hypothetical protein
VKYSGKLLGMNAAELFAVITAVLPMVAQSGSVLATLTWYVWAANGVVKFVALATCAVAIEVTMLRPSRDDDCFS